MKKLREHQRRLTHKQDGRSRVVENANTNLLPPAMTLEATFSSVKPKRRPLDLKKMRDSTIEEHVRQVMRYVRAR